VLDDLFHRGGNVFGGWNVYICQDPVAYNIILMVVYVAIGFSILPILLLLFIKYLIPMRIQYPENARGNGAAMSAGTRFKIHVQDPVHRQGRKRI
jgi:hypothetical protein